MSLIFNAANHIGGPAIVTFDSGIWYTEGDIDVDIVQEKWDVSTALFGVIDRRVKSLPVATVSFKPDGQVTSGRVGKAFPYTLNSIGKSVFGASDKTLVINTLAGQKYTFAKAGLIASPTLRLSAVTTAFDGNIQFLCVHKSNADVLVADNFLKIEAQAFSDVSFDQSKVITPGFTAAYGGSPFDAMESLDGFRIEQPLSVIRKEVDRLGVIDAYLASMGPAACRFTPAGMTEANWKTLTHLDGASLLLPGVSAGAGSTDLVITGTGLSVTLAKCNVSESKLAFGTSKERLGELVFIARNVFTVGVPGAMLTITVS
jgi:hypothetical protein